MAPRPRQERAPGSARPRNSASASATATCGGRKATLILKEHAVLNTLELINQDPTKPRMKLDGKVLSYNKQMLDASDPTTILGFARIFYISLYNKEPTPTWLRSLRLSLRANLRSALFEGYGWKITYNGKLYEKN